MKAREIEFRDKVIDPKNPATIYRQLLVIGEDSSILWSSPLLDAMEFLLDEEHAPVVDLVAKLLFTCPRRYGNVVLPFLERLMETVPNASHGLDTVKRYKPSLIARLLAPFTPGPRIFGNSIKNILLDLAQ